MYALALFLLLTMRSLSATENMCANLHKIVAACSLMLHCCTVVTFMILYYRRCICCTLVLLCMERNVEWTSHIIRHTHIPMYIHRYFSSMNYYAHLDRLCFVCACIASGAHTHTTNPVPLECVSRVFFFFCCLRSFASRFVVRENMGEW